MKALFYNKAQRGFEKKSSIDNEFDEWVSFYQEVQNGIKRFRDEIRDIFGVKNPNWSMFKKEPRYTNQEELEAKFAVCKYKITQTDKYIRLVSPRKIMQANYVMNCGEFDIYEIV